jgi:RNA polymerase sigma factor (sigma-70 family)
VLDNVRLVTSLAIRYQSRAPGVPIEDLVSAGMLGLVRAAERFDPSLGYRMTTFATPRINGAILDSLRQRWGWRRAPIRARRLLQRGEALAQRGRTARVGLVEIAVQLGITPTACARLADQAAATEMSLGDLASADLVETIPDPRATEFEQRVERDDLIERVYRTMRRLPDAEHRLLVAYYVEGRN